MSFRNTFVTDFIYQASEETLPASEAVAQVFRKYSDHLAWEINERGYGYFAGVLKTLDGSIHDMGLPEIVRELEKATKVPFRLTILLESGPQITYEITPRT